MKTIIPLVVDHPSRPPQPSRDLATHAQGMFYIETFGCQMNDYDSLRMADILYAKGFTPTNGPAAADVIILNTCSVREKAQEKLFHSLGRLRELKETNPKLLIGVAGCVASQEAHGILDRAPFVDLVFGPQSLHRLPELMVKRQTAGEAQVDVSFPELEKFDAMPTAMDQGACAKITIMEGCSKYCSFCVVPYTRGEEISRSVESILQETRIRVSRGAREITYLGQNVNAYMGMMQDNEEADLALLLVLAAEMPQLLRLRFTTSHPRDVTPRMISAFATNAKIASHLHLPLQSGSDAILSAMKRGYTRAEYSNKVRALKQHRPDLVMSSDFIVGFPGESEEDFRQTLQMVEDIGFDDSFSFIYSPRPGTPAARLPHPVAADVQRRRLMELQALIAEQSMKIRQTMVGRVEQVLIERPSAKNSQEMSGRTTFNHTVSFQATPELIGSMVNVEITQATTHTLRGRLVV